MNPIVITTLETERLILRPPTLSDAEAIESFVSDCRVAETTALIPHPYPPGSATEWVAHAERAWQEGRIAAFMICLRSDGELVGAIALAKTPEEEIELGYWIGVPHWGNGYATEALRRVLEYAFDELSLKRLATYHFAHNPASGRVMEKAGLKFQGVTPQGSRRGDQVFDDVRYGLDASEWHAAAV
jgi:ribosomal-protein-alanine N-acetyltransferase